MAKGSTKRRPPAKAPVPDYPDPFVYGEVKLDPTPDELKARGEFDPKDFCRGGKWDPMRKRPRFRPAWWHRWKNGTNIF